MKPETEEWIAAAEDDFEQARRAAIPPAVPKGVCYHAQQCVEKYLKALLEEAERPIPRTHDLGTLLRQVTELLPELAAFESDLRAIGPYAITARYPGMAIWDDVDAAAEFAATTMDAVRTRVRAALALPTEGDK